MIPMDVGDEEVKEEKGLAGAYCLVFVSFDVVVNGEVKEHVPELPVMLHPMEKLWNRLIMDKKGEGDTFDYRSSLTTSLRGKVLSIVPPQHNMRQTVDNILRGVKADVQTAEGFFREGQLDAAFELFNVAYSKLRRVGEGQIDIDQMVKCLNGIACCYIRLKRFQFAKRYLELALVFHPKGTFTLYRLAMVLYGLEEYAEAERRLRSLKSAFPGFCPKAVETLLMKIQKAQGMSCG